MKRCYAIIFTVAITLFLAACSTNNDLTSTPNLAPQFGSADEDLGVDVASVSTGRIYAASRQVGPLYEEYEGELYEDGYYDKNFLHRYDNTGKLIWTRVVAENYCYGYGDRCATTYLKSVETNSQGYAYVMYSTNYRDGDCYNVQHAEVGKYDALGNEINTFELGVTGASFWESYNGFVAMTVDGSGNVYAALEKINNINDLCNYETSYTNVIVKHGSSGSLLWQRTSTVGIPYGITVTSTGNIYVIGSQGMARYSSTGNLIWTKKGPSYAVAEASKIVASGSNLYVRSEKTVRKFDANGKLLWSKLQGGLNTLVFGDMTADANGNVYISGKYRPTTSSPANAFVRKLKPTGAILWTKTFGTPQYDDGRGIATINGSEIYVTGETQGSLAHTNIGGSDGTCASSTVWGIRSGFARSS